MRTTLSIDDDVLMAAKNLADRERRTVGEVMSDLARQALRRSGAATGTQATRNGIRLLPVREGVPAVTPEIVNQLRDELPG
jgi:hypothetical protein